MNDMPVACQSRGVTEPAGENESFRVGQKNPRTLFSDFLSKCRTNGVEDVAPYKKILYIPQKI